MPVTPPDSYKQASDVEREPEHVPPHFRARRTVAPAILSAFHLACDMRDVAIARQLLGTLESKMNEEAGSDASDAARVLNSLVAGHERLWTLRAGML